MPQVCLPDQTRRAGSGREAEAEWVQSGDKLLSMTWPLAWPPFIFGEAMLSVLPTGGFWVGILL